MVITKDEKKKPYKVSYIYYGDIVIGARFTQRIGPRHRHYERVAEIYDELKHLAYGKKFRRKN